MLAAKARTRVRLLADSPEPFVSRIQKVWKQRKAQLIKKACSPFRYFIMSANVRLLRISDSTKMSYNFHPTYSM